MIDFKKAFNQQNHNILIKKLAEMGVPPWLLRIVMAFLSNRKMAVRRNGETSSWKSMPGGGPQGTLLGLLLFLVLINSAGFDGQVNNAGEALSSRKNMKVVNKIHLKYVDDMTIAESIDIANKVVPSNHGPDNEDCILPPDNSEVYKKLLDTFKYAEENEMEINKEKTKLMVFNNCRSLKFSPDFKVDDHSFQVVEQMKILGVTVNSNLKWRDNTDNIVKKAYKRLWLIKRLKSLGANQSELIDMYQKMVRSILEFAVPVWNNSITIAEQEGIERVQKSALRIILGRNYESYDQALLETELETLEVRRFKLCLNFARKAEAHPKHKNWFVKKPQTKTRDKNGKYLNGFTRTERLKRSPIHYLTQLLNSN